MGKTVRAMTPEEYDAWYDTPRGRWIGEREWAMVSDALQLRPSDQVLDVGCGTGWFTRHAEAAASLVVGLDIDAAALEFARRRGGAHTGYLQGDATALPFPDASFDKVMSIAALCFVSDWRRAVAELTRVSRGRFAVGLLNRTSWLHLCKARRRDGGAYVGAHWHTGAELAHAMRDLQIADWTLSYGIFAPGGGPAARALERVLPASAPVGSFMVLAGRSPASRSVRGTPRHSTPQWPEEPPGAHTSPRASATPISSMARATVTCTARSVTLRSTRLPR